MTLPKVNPGQLIKSLDWNALIDLVNAMDARLAILESGTATSAPRIDLAPDVVTEGDDIFIYGSRFDFSKGGQTVFFGSTRATGFLGGSSDTLLVVEVPNEVQGATDEGATMTLTVGNLVGFTTRAITVKNKPDVVTGGVQFTYKGSTPTTPAQNSQTFYNFELKSTASQPLVVTVTPTIQVILPLPAGVSDPNLPSRVMLIDSDNTEKPNGQIALPEGATKNIKLRLTLPDQVNGLKFSVSASVSAAGITTVNEAVPNQQVGQLGEQPDPTVTNFDNLKKIGGSGQVSTDTGGVAGVDGTIKVAAGTTATFQVRTQFDFANGTNSYDLNAAVDNGASGWSAAIDPSMQDPLPVTAPGGLIQIKFKITAPNNATNDVVRLTLTRAGVSTNNKRSVAYRLTLL
jgi:hypothetical protein